MIRNDVGRVTTFTVAAARSGVTAFDLTAGEMLW